MKRLELELKVTIDFVFRHSSLTKKSVEKNGIVLILAGKRKRPSKSASTKGKKLFCDK